MNVAKLVFAATVMVGIMVLAACSPSSDSNDENDDEKEVSILAGTWSGNWSDATIGAPLFTHAPSGLVTITFEESDGSVTGTISLNTDPCAVPHVASDGTITGTLTDTTLAFSYDTPTTSDEQADPALTFVTFTGDVLTATNQIQGAYDANTCAPLSNTWNGQFLVTKQ